MAKIFIRRPLLFSFRIGRLVFCILFFYITHIIHISWIYGVCRSEMFAVESCAAHQKAIKPIGMKIVSYICMERQHQHHHHCYSASKYLQMSYQKCQWLVRENVKRHTHTHTKNQNFTKCCAYIFGIFFVHFYLCHAIHQNDGVGFRSLVRSFVCIVFACWTSKATAFFWFCHSELLCGLKYSVHLFRFD